MCDSIGGLSGDKKQTINRNGMLVLLLLTALSCNAQEGPIVDTVYGRIRGAVDFTETGASYEKFFGVPYATPPLGELRFSKSIPAQPWEGILDTTEFAKGCIEFNSSTERSEDCLFLNVYVPGQNRSEAGLAVMVFAHGGGFNSGSGSQYASEDLAVHGDLIVITINYRLGALGFLSTEDEASPGNYGLWDVKLALEWVRENIAAFGGSPDRVTVFGQSAGAAITSNVFISPETQGLFNRGICISGTSSSMAFGCAVPGSLSLTTRKLGERLGCPELENSDELLACLRGEDPYEINDWALLVPFLPEASQFYMPVIDGEFIPQNPSLTWNESLPTDLDLITGYVIQDGAFNVLLQNPDNPEVVTNLAETRESLERLFGSTFNLYPGDYAEIIAAIVDHYPGIEDNDTDMRTQEVCQVFTDFYHAYGHHYEASHHSLVSGQTYLYEYAYPLSFMMPFTEDYPWLIAEHGYDLWNIFGEPLFKDYVENVLEGEFSEIDKQMTSEMMSYFTNFANTGNPNEGKEIPVTWPQYSREAKEYLQFSETTQILVETEEELDDYRFWTYDFPLVAAPDV